MSYAGARHKNPMGAAYKFKIPKKTKDREKQDSEVTRHMRQVRRSP